MGVREKVLKALEEKREKKEIGNSLEADVELVAPKETCDFLETFKEELSGLLLVSGARARLAEGFVEAESFEVIVTKARGKKCERCWNWRESVGNEPKHPTLCRRCVGVLKGA